MPKRTNYPFLNLRESVERVKDLRTKLGSGPYKLGSVQTALGYKGTSGASTRAIASLSHYGLLKNTSAGYEISDLTLRIVRPVSEDDGKLAIKEAAAKPKLFSDLLDRYNGEPLPTQLQNFLIHEFEMTDQAANKAFNVFKKTLKYAELTDREGRINSPAANNNSDDENTEDSLIEEVTINPKEQRVDSSSKQIPEQKTNSKSEGLSELPSGIKISFPSSLDSAVLFGEFGTEIKNLENKAQRILKENKTHEDESE